MKIQTLIAFAITLFSFNAYADFALVCSNSYQSLFYHENFHQQSGYHSTYLKHFGRDYYNQNFTANFDETTKHILSEGSSTQFIEKIYSISGEFTYKNGDGSFTNFSEWIICNYREPIRS